MTHTGREIFAAVQARPEKITAGLDAPIIPVHLDRLWGSIFSFEGGRFFWKWPKRIPYPVTVSFGKPMAYPAAHEVRQAILELGAEAAARRDPDTLGRRFIRYARKNWSSFAMADSSGQELTYGRALAGAIVVARWLRRERRGEEMIGLLLPSSVGGALANIGATLAGKAPVNLNFTAGKESMAAAIAQCRIRTVITSKIFLAKAKIESVEGDGVLRRHSGAGKPIRESHGSGRGPAGSGALDRRTSCAGDSRDRDLLERQQLDAEGVPRFSHRNVLSNIDAIAQVFWIGKKDRIIGVLPFFHSFWIHRDRLVSGRHRGAASPIIRIRSMRSRSERWSRRASRRHSFWPH